MKTLLFFCDIIGTFDSQPSQSRKQLLCDFFDSLEQIGKREDATIKFSLVSSEQTNLVFNYVQEVETFLRRGNYPHITLGTSFSENHRVSSCLDVFECAIKDKTNQILRQAFIEQQIMILQYIDKCINGVICKKETQKRLASRRVFVLESISDALSSYSSNISFLSDSPISKIFFADDCLSNHSILKNFCEYQKNAPIIEHITPSQLEKSVASPLIATTSAIKKYLQSKYL